MKHEQVNEIHVGSAIRKRVSELGITKTEFGRRIGVRQQHVNRLFERDSIDTGMLLKISRALDFNFFALFFAQSPSVEASEPGDAASREEILRERITYMEGMEAMMKEQVAQLKSQLRDKDEIISLVRSGR